MSRHLHIVCLEAPWPIDHGHTIDVMSRIRALKQMDTCIHLHYFGTTDGTVPAELTGFCDSVDAYEGEKAAKRCALHLPGIVSSHLNKRLVARLKEDNHPILLEGIHCTGILPELDTHSRKIVVRMRNEESLYYREMAKAEQGWLKKLYLYNESRLLRKYSHHLPDDCVYACVTERDLVTLKKDYHLSRVEPLPAFPAWQSVIGDEGQGNFCLYHGNLSIPENEEAVAWLICKVFTQARVPFIVAGKKPSKKLQRIAGLCQHTCLVADPSENEINDLVRKAHIHTLPCFRKSTGGSRLKLLHALFEGRHCVTNDTMVAGTGLEGACHIGSNANAFASIIMQLHHHPFTREEIVLRRELLRRYDNEKNVQRLASWLW